MPGKEVTSITLRTEFVALARCGDVSRTELARRFGISRKTAYKWLRRHAADEALSDRSRRPQNSPTRTASEVEAAIVELRAEHPSWGGRKLARVLRNRVSEAVPAPGTITHIQRRRRRIERARAAHHAVTRQSEKADQDMGADTIG